MKLKVLGLALLSQGAAAQQMIRFGCSQLMGNKHNSCLN